jgi:iron complex transport system substrate-binding protein
MHTSHRRRSRGTRTLVGLVVGLSVMITACGSDDATSGSPTSEAPDPTEAPAPTDPSATDPQETDGPDTGESVPERIVSLSPTHTEMLFAIGAGDLLVAVDDQSNFPTEVSELPNDLSGFEPNVEAIAGYEPDLVVLGGDFTGLGDQLDTLGIAWWDGPIGTTIEDSFRQIQELGEATGTSEAADALVQEMEAEIESIVAATPVPDEPLSIYHELDPTLYSLDSTTLIGEIYSLLGLRNIADGADGEAGGYPQLSAEFIVSESPDLIFLADTKCCAETAETVAARPGWDAIAAVANGNVFEMDDDIASRWGPRVVDYLRTVADAVTQAQG